MLPLTFSSTRACTTQKATVSSILNQTAPTLENLIKIGFIDKQYNLLFTPSHIPPIKQSRWNALMRTSVGEITLEQYVTGFSDSLAEKGIKIDSYLRGGNAANVACIPDYFNFLLSEFLASKNLPEFAKLETDVPLPHDIDLFDHVLNDGIPPTALELYYMEYLKNNQLQFVKKLIPKTSLVFPYSEDYVLFVVEGIDRIIGRLNHPYLFTRDDIRIKFGELVPESADNFWQMVVERSLKIVRLQPWHEKDFRAGLAALQLMLEGHILIQEACPLEKIFRYAVSTGSDKIYSGAVDRAKLHCKKSPGFLLSAYIAYAHAGGNIPIESPPLPSLYKLALFSLCYKTSYTAYLESEMLILHWNKQKIIFPKNFSLTSHDKLFYDTDDWELHSQTDPAILDCDLAPLERVLFELTFQKPFTPLSESMKDALVDYLIEDGSVDLRGRFNHWLKPGKGLLGWTVVFLNYSIKHGLRLWNALKPDEKRVGIAEIVNKLTNPVYSYSLLQDIKIPKDFKLRLLKTILTNPALKPDLSEIIFEELIEEKSYPSQEQIEAYYQNSNNLKRLILWISQDPEGAVNTLQKYKNALKTEPETYIRLIKQFKQTDLAKDWVGSLPIQARLEQALLFFPEEDHLFLDALSSLPGLSEKQLMETLYQKGQPVFSGRSTKDLLAYLNQNFPNVMKEKILELLKDLSQKDMDTLQNWLKTHAQFLPVILENLNLLPLAIRHQISNGKFGSPWQKTLDLCFAHPTHLEELVPFYKNRKWVQTFFGSDTEKELKRFSDNYSGEFILNSTIITRHYIEGKISRQDFHQGAQDYIDFKDFIIYLKDPDKRERAYEVLFHLIKEPYPAMEFRKKIEDLIISKHSAFLKGNILYFQFLESFRNYLQVNDMWVNFLLEALNLELLHPVMRVDLMEIALRIFKSNELELFMKAEKAKVTKGQAIDFFQQRISLLKSAKGFSNNDRAYEAHEISDSAKLYLPPRNVNDILAFMEEFLKIKIVSPSDEPKNSTPDKSTTINYITEVQQLIHRIQSDPEWYSYHTARKLIISGIQSNVLTLDILRVLMEAIARSSPFLLEIDNQVVHDPYLEMLQMLCLVNIGTDADLSALLLTRVMLHAMWNNRLKESDKQSIVSYANQLKVIEGLTYDDLLERHRLIKELRHPIKGYVHQIQSEKNLKEAIHTFCFSASKNLSQNTLSIHNDPCLKALKEHSYLLRDNDKRELAYRAFELAIKEWCYIMKHSSPYMADYQSYLNIRKKTEDVILKELAHKKWHVYDGLIGKVTTFLKEINYPSLLNFLHINDPVLDAFTLNVLPSSTTSALIMCWLEELESTNNPVALYHVNIISNVYTHITPDK